MRILHAVEFYAPSRGGAQEVVGRISAAMAAEGHDVTVATTRLAERSATSQHGVRIEQFEISGNAVRGIEGQAEAYQRFLTETPFDVVMTYAAQQWTTDLLLDVADRIPAATVCVPCGYSGLRDPQYRGYFEQLPASLGRLDATIYHSNGYQDLAFARAHGLPNIHVIPNGASAAEFGELDDEAAAGFRARHRVRGPLVLTVGSHTAIKGHRQALAAFALARIGPATLIINGDPRPGAGCTDSCQRWVRRLGPLLRAQGKRVLLLDLEREELVDAYGAADVFLLLSRCECSPVVLYEAAAAGTPFVSADVGNAREVAEWTGAGEIVPTRRTRSHMQVASPAHATRALTRLLGDPARRAEMGQAGRRAWSERFTWEQLAGSYLSLYESLVHRTPSLASVP